MAFAFDATDRQRLSCCWTSSRRASVGGW